MDDKEMLEEAVGEAFEIIHNMEKYSVDEVKWAENLIDTVDLDKLSIPNSKVNVKVEQGKEDETNG